MVIQSVEIEDILTIQLYHRSYIYEIFSIRIRWYVTDH